MKTIALLSDFGVDDNYVGLMKGVILTVNPRVHLIDITHQIKSHSLKQAAFLLLKSYSYFPKGTIFLAVIDPGVGSARRAISVKTRNYYFVGPDNGILAPAADHDRIDKIVSLDNRKYFLTDVSRSFQGRDIFAPVAAYLSKNIKIGSLGRTKRRMEPLALPRAQVKGNTLKGEVIYVDKFGNLITNIRRSDLLDFAGGKKFIARIGASSIRDIYACYADAKGHRPFFIEGSFSYLEISLREKRAKDYLKATAGRQIIITRCH